MVLAASVMGRNRSTGKVERLGRGAALEQQQNVFFRYAVRDKSVIARDAAEAKNFFVKRRRSADVPDVEARFDYSGKRWHELSSEALRGKLVESELGILPGRSFVARFKKAFNVFSQNISFEVDRIAGFPVAKIGVLVRVGNYGDFHRSHLLEGSHKIMPASDG